MKRILLSLFKKQKRHWRQLKGWSFYFEGQRLELPCTELLPESCRLLSFLASMPQCSRRKELLFHVRTQIHRSKQNRFLCFYCRIISFSAAETFSWFFSHAETTSETRSDAAFRPKNRFEVSTGENAAEIEKKLLWNRFIHFLNYCNKIKITVHI